MLAGAGWEERGRWRAGGGWGGGRGGGGGGGVVGVGGVYGAARAQAGANVTFIARGAHLAAMKSKGLKVESPRGDTHVLPTVATDDPSAVDPVDVGLFCVK